MKSTDLTRFMRFVEPVPDGCWLWVGAKDNRGYGFFWLGGRTVRAYIASYRHFIGQVPNGKEIDHTCRKTSCVNPGHLDAVTHRENVRRGNAGQATGAQNRAKTHCPQGHRYTKENTYRYPDGRRKCRRCYRKVKSK